MFIALNCFLKWAMWPMGLLFIGNNTRNSPGFYNKNGRQSRQSQNYIPSFLENIKYKTNFILPSDTNIVYRHVFLVYFIIFAGQPLLTNFILLRSEDRVGIISLIRSGDICHFNDRTFCVKKIKETQVVIAEAKQISCYLRPGLIIFSSMFCINFLWKSFNNSSLLEKFYMYILSNPLIPLQITNWFRYRKHHFWVYF